jgi:hypothetical protein
MIHAKTIEFSWHTLAYEHRPKSVDWYWALGIISVVGSGVAFLQRNFLFGFLILFGGFLVALFASKKPNELSVEISVHGVNVNNDLIYFKNISGFWMYENMFGVPKLVLKTNRNLHPMTSLPIPEDIDIHGLRNFLMQHIPETELQESFTDLLLEKIGF